MIMAEMEKHLTVSINVINQTGGIAGSNGMVYVQNQPDDGYILVGLSESNVTAAVQWVMSLSSRSTLLQAPC